MANNGVRYSEAFRLAAVERMKANPRLSPADVSDPVRTMTQGLIDPGQPKAQNAIVEAVDKRIKSAPDAVNSAYTRAMSAKVFLKMNFSLFRMYCFSHGNFHSVTLRPMS